MSEKLWYVAVAGQQQGPFPAEEVVAGARAGRFGRDAHVFSQGMAGWVPIQSQPEFAGAFAGGTGGVAGGVPPPPGRQAAHEIDYEIVGHEMQFVEIVLDPGESCVAEAGAFMYMEPGIRMETIFGDGSASGSGGGLMGKLMNAGKRMLTGESLFMTLFTNSGGGRQKVAFASPYPGRIVPLDLAQHGGLVYCEKDAFLCAAKGISIGIAFQRKLGTGLFGGEGFILQKLEGDGLAFVHSGGTIVEKQLAPGELLRVDTGCLVAFESAVQYDIQMVPGIKTAIFGGEGLFFAALTGPGKIWLQSLPFSRLAGRVLSALPRGVGGRKGEGSILGGLGDLIGGD
ncbi:MAG TPA: TIGR00266 family protein [Thermoanaerobaculia bacterium]|nr:TIGR00266 family protein [Thermoanaerobaculia bacterium]